MAHIAEASTPDNPVAAWEKQLLRGIESRAHNLVGVREFQAVADLMADPMAVGLTCEIRLVSDVRSFVYGDDEEEVRDRIVAETPARYVALGQDLSCGSSGKRRQDHYGGQPQDYRSFAKSHRLTCSSLWRQSLS
jgi:hypothetical protein